LRCVCVAVCLCCGMLSCGKLMCVGLQCVAGVMYYVVLCLSCNVFSFIVYWLCERNGYLLIP